MKQRYIVAAEIDRTRRQLTIQHKLEPTNISTCKQINGHASTIADGTRG